VHNTVEIHGEVIIAVKDKVNLTSTEEEDQLSSEQYTVNTYAVKKLSKALLGQNG